jgi:hypothetical protein
MLYTFLYKNKNNQGIKKQLDYINTLFIVVFGAATILYGFHNRNERAQYESLSMAVKQTAAKSKDKILQI